MLQFPNAKINIGLNILQKREDGFHDLESVFFPIAIQDVLEIVETQEDTVLHTTGNIIEGKQEDNLVYKAYRLLKNRYPQIPNLDMYLHKIIPSGAGLGGGSSDASFMLMMLNKQFNLQICKEELLSYSAQLGSDCPFFIHNIPCYVTGRGDVLNPIELDLSMYHFVIVKPEIHVNTKWAFSKIVPQKRAQPLSDIITLPIEAWKHGITNDFEKPIFEAHPILDNIKNKLYKMGAIYASMSGSGSALYGIFEEKISVENEFKDEQVFVI